MSQFNQLDPAEAERLALLLKKLGEAQQAIGQVLLHGYETRHPGGGPTNRETLERGLGDIRAAEALLLEAGDLNSAQVQLNARQQQENVKHDLHHQ